MNPCFTRLLAFSIWLCASTELIHAQQTQVRAEPGGIAIGGNVTGSTVIISIPQEKVDELVRDAKRPLEGLPPNSGRISSYSRKT
jgi:hypothetical protein